MDLRTMSKLLYQLKLANQELTAMFEKETGFSLTRYELMQFLMEKETCSQSDLQKVLHIDSAAVTRHLKYLEDKGYVTRERNQKNHREVLVTITEFAQNEVSHCAQAYAEAKSSFPFALDEQEQSLLVDLLTKLIE